MAKTCLRFVCKQSDENYSVHGCPFLASPVIFQRFFSVWWLYLEINHSLCCWNYLYYIFIYSCRYTTFQIKTVFNNVLFSTEMHAHLLALSHILVIWSNVLSYRGSVWKYLLQLYIVICAKKVRTENPSATTMWAVAQWLFWLGCLLLIVRLCRTVS